MGQGSLFDMDSGGVGAYGHPSDGPTPPHCGKATSRLAAEKIEPRTGTDRARILEHIRACGSAGCTRDEAVLALGMNPSTLRPRWIELERAGWITNTGRQRTNQHGNFVEVYTASE